jgi:hypothetical protein
MDKKSEATPEKGGTPSDAEITAEKVRAARKAKREEKAAAAAAVKAAKKNAMNPQGGRKNPFGVPGSVSKGHTVARSIISRARGGRSR